MPRIIEVQPRSAVPGPTNQPHATPEDFGGDGGMESFGAGIEKAGDYLTQWQEKKDKFKAATAAAQAMSDGLDDITKMKQSAPPGADGFTQQVHDYWNNKRQSLLEANSSLMPQARSELELRMNEIQQTFHHDAIGFEAASQTKYQSDLIDSLGNKIANQIEADPSFLSKGVAAVNDSISAIPSNKLNEQAKTESQKQWTERLHDHALDGEVVNTETSNPSIQTVQAKIDELEQDGNVYRNKSSMEQYKKSLDSLKRFKEHLLLQKDYQSMDDIKDAALEAKVTGNTDRLKQYTPQWIASNIKNRAQQDAMIKLVKTSAAAGEGVVETRDNPFPDTAAKLSSMNPYNEDSALKTSKGGSDTTFTERYSKYEALQRGFKTNMDSFVSDPVQYGLRTRSDLKNIYQDFLQNPTPEKAVTYADAQTTFQRNMYPGKAPSILSDNEKGTVYSQLNSLSNNPQGAEQGLKILHSALDMYGPKYRDTVLRDLKSTKMVDPETGLKTKEGLNDAQYVAAFMNNPTDHVAALDMLRAGEMKEADYAKMVPDIKNSRTQAQLEVEKNLLPFKRTLMAANNGEQTYSSLQKAFQDYVVYQEGFRGQDASVAAHDIVARVVNSQYRFYDSMRVPVKNGAPVATMADVKAQDVLRNIEQFNILPARSVDGSKDEDLDRYIPNVKAYGKPVTIRDPESGEDDAGIGFLDGNRGKVMVKGKNGKPQPLFIPWHELDSYKEPAIPGIPEASNESPIPGGI